MYVKTSGKQRMSILLIGILVVAIVLYVRATTIITNTGVTTTGNLDAASYSLGGSQLGFVAPATFIIDVSGSTYRAWYGANSTLAFSGTNAQTVIQGAIDTVEVQPYIGTLFIKAGRYNGLYLNITKPLILEGESMGNVNSTEVSGGTLLVGLDPNPSNLPTITDMSNGVVFRDLQIGSLTTAIQIGNRTLGLGGCVSQTKIEDVSAYHVGQRFVDFYGYGLELNNIYITQSGAYATETDGMIHIEGITSNSAKFVTVDNVQIQSNTGPAFFITKCSCGLFTNLLCEANTMPSVIEYAQNWEIGQGCYFEDNVGGHILFQDDPGIIDGRVPYSLTIHGASFSESGTGAIQTFLYFNNTNYKWSDVTLENNVYGPYVVGSNLANFSGITNGQLQLSNNHLYVNALTTVGYVNLPYQINVNNDNIIGNTGLGAHVSSVGYIIYSNGTTYFMKNGTTGQIDFSSSNTSAVINNAIGNLTTGRTWQETIVLKGDLGYVTDVSVPNYTRVVGEDAKVTLAAGQTQMFHIPTDGNNYGDISFENINFVADSASGSIALYMYAAVGGLHKHVCNLLIKDCSFTGFSIGIEAYPQSSNGFMQHNRFVNCGYGIFNVAGGASITDNTFDPIPNGVSWGYDGKIGIYLLDCGSTSIVGNYFKASSAGNLNSWAIFVQASSQISITANIFCIVPYCIRLYHVHYCNIESNSFSYTGNTIIFDDGEAQDPCTGILVKGNVIDHASLCQVNDGSRNIAHEVVFEGNRVDACTPAFCLFGNNYVVKLYDNVFTSVTGSAILGTGTLIARGNVGFVTENTGSNTITALSTTVVVPHGLAGTVTFVQLTPTSDLGGRTYWISSKGATTFTITISSADLDNNLSFDWEATYVP